LDQRPIIVAVAGPNGAGKTTFYHAHLARSALRYVSPDKLASELNMGAPEAMKAADALRQTLVKQKISFAFETVFSDPVGDKLGFLKRAATSGYMVALCFIGLANPQLCEERVAMRVSQGEHDVPTEKLKSRFPRTLQNLKAAIQALPIVYVFDNSDLNVPFHEVAVFRKGQWISKPQSIPPWLAGILPPLP
jgi:predicted ABC-type ATPase